MAGTLLVIGVTLFLVGSAGLARGASARGHSWLLLLIPFASARYVQHNWSDVWLAALMRVLGFALVLAAAGITLARDPMILEDPKRLFSSRENPGMAGSKLADMNSFVNSSEAIQIAIRNDDNENLSGRIHGKPFLYDRVEIIDGLLSARQGAGFLPELEVRILLDRNFSALERRQKIYVQPGDPDPPVVHVSWKDAEGALQTEVVRTGYRMELQLAPLTRHQLNGFLQIILPDTHRSFLSGEFVAYTNRLRYVGDRVDLTYDHEDTLKYVAEQYLQTQYPDGAIERIIFSDTDMRLSRDKGSTSATVRLASGRIERRDIPLERSDIGWSVRPSSVSITVIEENGRPSAVPESSTQTELSSPEEDDKARPRAREERIEFAGLSDYVGLAVETRRTDDKRQQGVLRSLDDKRVILEASMGGGTVRYQVERERLRSVRVPARNLVLLLDPDKEREGAPAQESPASREQGQAEVEPEQPDAAPSSAEATAGAGEQAQSVAERLTGKRVTVVDDTGRARTGLLKSVVDGRVTLSVKMGAGSVDYYYKMEEIRSVEATEEP